MRLCDDFSMEMEFSAWNPIKNSMVRKKYSSKSRTKTITSHLHSAQKQSQLLCERVESIWFAGDVCLSGVLIII